MDKYRKYAFIANAARQDRFSVFIFLANQTNLCLPRRPPVQDRFTKARTSEAPL